MNGENEYANEECKYINEYVIVDKEESKKFTNWNIKTNSKCYTN